MNDMIKELCMLCDKFSDSECFEIIYNKSLILNINEIQECIEKIINKKNELNINVLDMNNILNIWNQNIKSNIEIQKKNSGLFLLYKCYLIIT